MSPVKTKYIQLLSESWQLLWTVLKLYRQSGISYDEYFESHLRYKQNYNLAIQCDAYTPRLIWSPWRLCRHGNISMRYIYCLSILYLYLYIYIDLMMFSLEKPELGAGTMYAPAGTTFTKQTSATLKMSNIANIRKNRVGEGCEKMLKLKIRRCLTVHRSRHGWIAHL